MLKDRLLQALELQLMTSAELSRRSGIDKSSICRYLKGTITPKPYAVKSMAQALGVSASWLMGFDEDIQLAEIPPIEKKDYNPIDYMKLTPANRIRIKAYYQALLDTQSDNSEII